MAVVVDARELSRSGKGRDIQRWWVKASMSHQSRSEATPSCCLIFKNFISIYSSTFSMTFSALSHSIQQKLAT